MNSKIEIANIGDASRWFEVLQTAKQSQTAMMTLEPGKSSGDTAEAHAHSEQVLLVMEGELTGEIDGNPMDMKKGDVMIIPAGVKHKFTNRGNKIAITFNVYSPPEYPAE